MKVMKQKWCWMGLVLCMSSTAWAAKDHGEKSGSDTKKSSSDATESKADATKNKADATKDKADATKDKDDATKDDATKDDATDDESADEEEVTKPPPKKATKKVAAEAGSPKRNSTLNMGLLGSVGASPFTRLGLGLRGGLTMGPSEGLYVGVIGTFFTGTSVTQSRLSGTAERSRNAIVLAAEVGYDVFAATDFLVRPYISPGFALISDKTCATGECTNDNGARLTLAPGLQGVYSLGSVFLGGDLRYQIILNTTDASAAVISLTAGLRI